MPPPSAAGATIDDKDAPSPVKGIAIDHSNGPPIYDIGSSPSIWDDTLSPNSKISPLDPREEETPPLPMHTATAVPVVADDWLRPASAKGAGDTGVGGEFDENEIASMLHQWTSGPGQKLSQQELAEAMAAMDLGNMELDGGSMTPHHPTTPQLAVHDLERLSPIPLPCREEGAGRMEMPPPIPLPSPVTDGRSDAETPRGFGRPVGRAL